MLSDSKNLPTTTMIKPKTILLKGYVNQIFIALDKSTCMQKIHNLRVYNVSN